MRRSLALALAAPCTLLLACGGDEEVVAATPAGVLAASQATIDAETASVEFSTTVDLSGLGLPGATGPLELTGVGLVDFAGHRSELEMDFGALFEGLGDAVPAGAAEVFDEPLRAIQDGATSYACGSFFTMLAGTECLSIDLGEQLGDAAASSLFTGGGADAEALLQSLGGAESVEEVGEDEVVGVRTTHLRGTFTLARAVEQLPEEAAAELRSAFDSMGFGAELADTEQQFDVWVDDDGRVRQVRQTIDLGAIPEAEGAGPVVVEFRYVEFGVPVDIEIPTDATDISELQGLLGG